MPQNGSHLSAHDCHVYAPQWGESTTRNPTLGIARQHQCRGVAKAVAVARLHDGDAG